jgi:hypothetical protein
MRASYQSPSMTKVTRDLPRLQPGDPRNPIEVAIVMEDRGVVAQRAGRNQAIGAGADGQVGASAQTVELCGLHEDS